MRILYQLTSPMEKTALGAPEVARRREFLRTRAAGADVDVRSLAGGPATIESAWEAALVVPELCDAVRRAQQDGFHAVIIGCFSDPGLEALRELTAIPIVGPGSAALHVAAQLGTRIGVISPLDGAPGRVAARFRALGLGELLGSVRSVGMPVLDVARNREPVLDRLEEVGRAAMREDRADVLVLGCMSMGFLGITDELTKRLEIPVVNPVTAALKTAEMVVSMGLAHSKAAYPVPPKMEVS
ncbi:MAG: aspartate/glutamate racemase family protein [Candidatus Rokubacteria bacterium]|nr:aspartate/glutamate racemase family protein [Candidatus Rokubacteria bacterium]